MGHGVNHQCPMECRYLHRGPLVRTTLNLNNDLMAQAKAFAARQHLSLTRLIEEGLALRLRQEKLVTLDRDFVTLLPLRQLTLLSP